MSVATGCAGGIAVEPTGNRIDQRVAALEPGTSVELGSLVGGCDRVRLVPSYTPSAEIDERAGVDLDLDYIGDDAIVVVWTVADKVAAARVARVPVDLNDVAPADVSCTTEVVLTPDGRAALR